MKTPEALRRLAFALAIVPALTACEGLVPEDGPRTARVVADITAASPVELVVSTDFVILLDELTGNQDPEFISADTVYLTAGFDETYSLDPNDARLFVRLSNSTEGLVAPVRLRVLLDGTTEYDASANLGNGGFLEYLYRFNQPTIGG